MRQSLDDADFFSSYQKNYTQKRSSETHQLSRNGARGCRSRLIVASDGMQYFPTIPPRPGKPLAPPLPCCLSVQLLTRGLALVALSLAQFK